MFSGKDTMTVPGKLKVPAGTRRELRGFDYLVIGTGPGAAPVALELAKAGKSVCILEKGHYTTIDKLGFPKSLKIMDKDSEFDGWTTSRCFNVGGSSLMYNGNIMRPSQKVMNAMGINFMPEAEELIDELKIAPLPDRYYENYKGSLKIFEAADKMGVKFEKQLKAIDPDRCKPGCDYCMFGCKTGAKWTTRTMIDQAVALGATLIPDAPVDRLLFADERKRNKVIGVRLHDGSVIQADKVVLGGGGEGSPAILLRSGVEQLGDHAVGSHYFIDPMLVIGGFAKTEAAGCWDDMTFTHAVEQFGASDGFIIGNCGGLTTYLVMNMRGGKAIRRQQLPRIKDIKKYTCLFVKLGDVNSGQMHADETYSKPVCEPDLVKAGKSREIVHEIYDKIGVDMKTVAECKWLGGHPGGTLAMGSAVNQDFSTEIDGLYVCDGSVMPVSPGVPPVLTITSFGRLCGRVLTGQVKVEDRKIGNEGKKKKKA